MEKDYLKTRFEPEEFEKLKKKLVRYECALDVVRTQLSNLNTYYNNFEAINPIEHIKHRLKSPESIAGKLKKKDLPVTADAADELYGHAPADPVDVFAAVWCRYPADL